MNTFKIPFAFDIDGKAFDYKSAVKGVDYFCQCGETVRIRGGEQIRNHFYHINETECNNESIIHKAYKSVFLEEKRIKTPSCDMGIDGFGFMKSTDLIFDSIDLEKYIFDFKPDAIGYKDGNMYLIEFAKTHYVGVIKQNKIREVNLFCIEVSIRPTIKTISEIRQHIIGVEYYKKIIHIPTFPEFEEFKDKVRTHCVFLKREHKKEIERLTRLNENTKIRQRIY